MFLPRLFILGFLVSLISLSAILISRDFPEKYQLKVIGQEKVLGLSLKASHKTGNSISPSSTPQSFVSSTEVNHKVTAKLSTPPPKKVNPEIKQASTVPEGNNSSGILTALNNYRTKKGVGALSWDKTLGDFASSRASHFASIGNMDNHAGFREMLNNDGFSRMGFWKLAENSSTGFRGSPTELIENFYGKSSGHDANQLNPAYTHVGIGVSGLYTDLVFGGKKK